MTEIRQPEDCSTMVEVRAGVDDTDQRIVALLARRFRYMDAAARIKPERSAVRDERRKAEVIERVRASAEERGLDQGAVTALYEQLIEASIAYEFGEFDRLQASSAGAPVQPAHE